MRDKRRQRRQHAGGALLYGTVTGEIRRQTFPAEHGLSIDKALTWVGGTLLARYSRITAFESTPSGGGYAANDAAVFRWDAASGDFDPEVGGRFPGFDYQAAPAGDRLVVVRKDRVYDLMAPDGSTDRLGRLDVPFAGPVFVNPSRTLVATAEDLDGPSTFGSEPSPIAIADVGGPDAGVSRRLEALPYSWVVGWRDDRHLIVAESPADASKLQRYLSIDVDTGAREQLLELPNMNTEIQTQIAADALTAPSFDAPEPNFPGAISRWRRRRWREVASEDLPETAHHDPDTAAKEDLRQALASLAPRQRAVIVLRYFEDLSEAETPDALDVAVGTVKSQTRDALRVARKRMPALEEDLLPGHAG